MHPLPEYMRYKGEITLFKDNGYFGIIDLITLCLKNELLSNADNPKSRPVDFWREV